MAPGAKVTKARRHWQARWGEDQPWAHSRALKRTNEFRSRPPDEISWAPTTTQPPFVAPRTEFGAWGAIRGVSNACVDPRGTLRLFSCREPGHRVGGGGQNGPEFEAVHHGWCVV
jgi:hypothetical protein